MMVSRLMSLLPVKERGPDVREQEKGDERSAPNGCPERAGQEKEDDRRAAVGGSAVDDPGEESDARGLGRRGRVLRPQSAVEHGSEYKDTALMIRRMASTGMDTRQ